MRFIQFTLYLFLTFLKSSAQETPSTEYVFGNSIDPTSTAYNCVLSKCNITNNCQCASLNPPGGLKQSEVPQFITLTLDDAVQTGTIDIVNSLIGNRSNPNGCRPKLTFFVSLDFTNYSLATTWYSKGNEIADHTMTHVGTPPENEIVGNRIALNILAGIPISSIQGFRAPFLSYSAETIRMLGRLNFTYDSSMTANNDGKHGFASDRTWPYTLDYGMVQEMGSYDKSDFVNIIVGSVHDCEIPGICGPNGIRVPGLWEIPMLVTYDKNGAPNLMDSYLNSDPHNTLDMLKSTFDEVYNSTRTPFGIYVHPAHLEQESPGPNKYVRMLNRFLDYAMNKSDVWMVSNKQLLAWMRQPTRISKLDDFQPLKCLVPQAPRGICNGLELYSDALEETCRFEDHYYNTCYGCPIVDATPDNPSPAQAHSGRSRIAKDCDTVWWDPIKGECICKEDSCKYGPGSGNKTTILGVASKSGKSRSTLSGKEINWIYFLLMLILCNI